MSVAAWAWSPEALVRECGTLAGGQARLAADGDAVAGVRPAVVVEPGGEDEVAALLAFADREGLKVLVRGGGTQLGLGFPPSGGDMLLSTARLNRVVEHTPGDLTVTVEAGVPLVALQETLGKAGQWLALDPALPAGATIGGIVATAASGPRRLRYGGVRDQIIGVRVVRPDGTIAKGGGKVVKNVAGFDLPKLFTGSLGTLGVIVAATFRLYPVPAGASTAVLTASDPAPLCELAVRTIATTLAPSAVMITGAAAGEPCALAIRFEGDEAACADRARELLAQAGFPAAAGRILAGADDATYWDTIGQGPTITASGAVLRLKVSLLPTNIADWLAQLQALAAQHDVAVAWRLDAGHGLGDLRLSGAAPALRDTVAELRSLALARQGSLVVTAAPPDLAHALDPWGPTPALVLMRRVKEQFDPHATLNPGRFVGGI
ncbi:MAG: FAD-binding oxidoreductase [Thermomicrobiales bacterium]